MTNSKAALPKTTIAVRLTADDLAMLDDLGEWMVDRLPALGVIDRSTSLRTAIRLAHEHIVTGAGS